jgi:hypothetical protein
MIAVNGLESYVSRDFDALIADQDDEGFLGGVGGAQGWGDTAWGDGGTTQTARNRRSICAQQK